MEMDVIQEAPGLSRRQQQATGEPGRWSKAGRSLKDVRHGLPTGVDMPEVDSLEAAAAKEASFEQEVGRVLLQWGQSSEGLQEMLLQVRSNRQQAAASYYGWALVAVILSAPQERPLHNLRTTMGKQQGNVKACHDILAALCLAVASSYDE